MVMQICPNCLISVSYQKNICHQCGYEIEKSPQSSSDILPRIRPFKPIFFISLNSGDQANSKWLIDYKRF